MAAYAFVTKKHLLPVFSTIDEIDEGSVQRLVDTKLDEGLGLTMVKRIVLILEMVLRYCARQGWAVHHGFKPHYPVRKEKYRPDVLTIHEEKKLFRYLEENPVPQNLGLLICICCGLRNGEVCSLKWSDIDFDNKLIRVSRTVFRLKEAGDNANASKLVIGLPKTPDSKREVPVTGALHDILEGNKPTTGTGIYVTSGRKKPADPQSFRNNFKRVLRILGLPAHKVHSLRHTFATRCVESKCDVKTLSSLLGHSNVSTTLNLYVHPDMEQKRRCVENMMKML